MGTHLLALSVIILLLNHKTHIAINLCKCPLQNVSVPCKCPAVGIGPGDGLGHWVDRVDELSNFGTRQLSCHNERV